MVLILLCLETLVLGWLWELLCRFLARNGLVLLFIEVAVMKVERSDDGETDSLYHRVPKKIDTFEL